MIPNMVTCLGWTRWLELRPSQFKDVNFWLKTVRDKEILQLKTLKLDQLRLPLLPHPQEKTHDAYLRCLFELFSSLHAAGHPKAIRNCSTAASPLYFYWERHVRQSCGESEKTISVEQVVQVRVSAGNAKEVAEFLSNQTSSSGDTSDDKVEAISTILNNIVDAGSGDTEVEILICTFFISLILRKRNHRSRTVVFSFKVKPTNVLNRKIFRKIIAQLEGWKTDNCKIRNSNCQKNLTRCFWWCFS